MEHDPHNLVHVPKMQAGDVLFFAGELRRLLALASSKFSRKRLRRLCDHPRGTQQCSLTTHANPATSARPSRGPCASPVYALVLAGRPDEFFEC